MNNDQSENSQETQHGVTSDSPNIVSISRKKRIPRVLAKKRTILLIMLVALVAAGAVWGIPKFLNRNVYAKVGNFTITKKEYNATKQSWINAYKKPNTKLDDKNSIDNQTRDILVLNAALKTEAQKRGISYSQAEVDKYSLPKYNEKGGKFLYIKAYERDYQWTEQDVMLRRTNDYLQYKLKDKLIKDRVYSEVYIRWDNIRIQKTEDINKPAPTEEEKAGQILKEKYLPLFEQKKSAAELEKAVDIRDGDSLEQQKKAYASTRGTGSQFSTLYTINLAANPYKPYPGDKGEDMAAKLDSLKNVGDYTQPFRSNIGKYSIIRLESSSGGGYANWEAMVQQYEKDAGLTDGKNTVILSFVKKAIQRISSAIFPKAYAYPDCTAGIHSVPYYVTLKDIDTGALLNGSVTAWSQRHRPDCGMGPYLSQGFNPSPYVSSPVDIWFNVSFTASTGGYGPGYLGIALDCMGPVWDHSYNVPGYTFVSETNEIPGRPQLGHGDNAMSYNILAYFKNNSPPTGEIDVIKMIPDGSGGWREGQPGGNPQIAIGLLTSTNTSLYAPGLTPGGQQPVSTASPSGGWTYVKTINTLTCPPNTSSESTNMSLSVNVFADPCKHWVQFFYQYTPPPPKGALQLVTEIPNGSGGWTTGNVPGSPNTCVTGSGVPSGYDCSNASVHPVNNLDPGPGYYAYVDAAAAQWEYKGFVVAYNPGCNGHPDSNDNAPHPAPAGAEGNSFNLRVCQDQTTQIRFRFAPEPKPFTLTPIASAATSPAGEDENPSAVLFSGTIASNLNMNLTSSSVAVNRKYYRIRGGVTTSLATDDNTMLTTFSATTPVSLSDKNIPVPGALAGDSYCTVVTVNPGTGLYNGAGAVITPGPAKPSTPSCVTIANLPYVSFYGNDVSAGAAFKRPSACIAGDGAGATISTNLNAANVGSSVQFAAFALGSINTFVSASQRTVAPTTPKGLSFASTTGPYGGVFGANPRCLDYYGTPPSPDMATTSVNVSAIDGVKSYKPGGAGTGTLTLSASTPITRGKHVTLYVDGNVVISNNLTMESSGWTTTDSIPTFDLIVKGNIYVQNNVNQLDGWYIAQPKNDGTKGEITTCAKPGGGLYNLASSELYTNCATQLVINGSFTAKKVHFLRTANSLRDGSLREAAPGKAAEVFRFSPETYLAKHALPQSAVTGVGSTDYYTTLPPVL
jgi:hypothetical protein